MMTETKNADGSITFTLTDENGVVTDEWTRPGPTNMWECDCGETVERFRGQGEVQCDCGQWFNASGQRLRNDWMGNPSMWDDEIGDLEGYEIQHADW